MPGLQSLDRIESGRHVVIDLKADAGRWPELRFESAIDEGLAIRHVFGFEE